MANKSQSSRLPHPSKAALILFGLAVAWFPNSANRLASMFNWSWVPAGPPSVLIWNWAAVAVLVALILLIERRPLSSIGIKVPSWIDLGLAVLFALAATVASGIAHTLFPLQESAGIQALSTYSRASIAGLIITAAITEEVLYRGYTIERISEFTGSAFV